MRIEGSHGIKPVRTLLRGDDEAPGASAAADRFSSDNSSGNKLQAEATHGGCMCPKRGSACATSTRGWALEGPGPISSREGTCSGM